MKKLKLLITFLVLLSCGGGDDPKPEPIPANKAPIVNATASTYNAKVGEEITFDASGSTDPDGDNTKLDVMYDFDGDGAFDTGYVDYNAAVKHAYPESGNYIPTAKVKDEKGATTKKDLSMIEVHGNVAPIAHGVADRTNGVLGDVYNVDWSGSNDPDGDNSDLEARLIVKEGATPTDWTPYGNPVAYQFDEDGNYNPMLQVKDKDGAIDEVVLANLGILDPNNNPIGIDFQVPKYIVAGEEFIAKAVTTEANERPVEYNFDFVYGSQVASDDDQEEFTYPESEVGKKTLEVMVKNDYNVENSATKEVHVGGEIPYTQELTDPVDGTKYKVKFMDDGKLWLVENFKREIGEADWYQSDSLNNSVFGRYYSADEVDQVGTVTLVKNGVEFNFKVPTADEWRALRDAYGGINEAGAALKYKEFTDGENVGATNTSGFSAMLGGGYGDSTGYSDIGNYGSYMASDNKFFYFNKDNKNLIIVTPNEDTRTSVRLVKVD